MSDIFDRYHECNEAVSTMPECENKRHAGLILTQLLHIEQTRRVASDNYGRYCREMNEWENNLVRDIKRMTKEANP